MKIQSLKMILTYYIKKLSQEKSNQLIIFFILMIISRNIQMIFKMKLAKTKILHQVFYNRKITSNLIPPNKYHNSMKA